MVFSIHPQSPSPAAALPAPLPSPTYVPVHRRVPAQRTLPVYTIPELLALHRSPLVDAASPVAHDRILSNCELEAVARVLSSGSQKRVHTKTKRGRNADADAKVLQESNSKNMEPESTKAAATKSKKVLIGPVPASRRRVIGGTTASARIRRKSLEAATWRSQPARRLSTTGV